LAVLISGLLYLDTDAKRATLAFFLRVFPLHPFIVVGNSKSIGNAITNAF
jgi:hypothetical protein